MRKALLVAIVLLLAIAGPSAVGLNARQEIGVPAKIVDFTPDSTTIKSYATTDYTGETPVETTTPFRVVSGTGNAAELWLTTSSDGRLYDLGGRYINYSDDRGASWKSVQPIEPLVNGEGSVAQAPNGDIVGVTWDPYAGDRVWTYKYSAAEKTWYYSVNVFHTPFWDRPGIDIVPGPFETPTGTVPYITFINGFPHTVWHYSTDGLTYPYATVVDDAQTADIQSWLDAKPDPSNDWIQSNQYFPFAALGDGKALMGSRMFSPEDMKWHSFSTPEGPAPDGPVHTDSLGRIHNVQRSTDGFVYRMSSDGGQNWAELYVEGLRPGDFRANAAAGVAAVSGVDGTQDVLVKIDISGAEPQLLKRYVIGKGDDCRCSGIGFYGVQGGHRFDFHSVVIFPDGKLGVSFIDSTTRMKFPTLGLDVVAPALAVELDPSEAPAAE